MTACTGCGNDFPEQHMKNGRAYKCCPRCREESRASRARVAARNPDELAEYQRTLRRRYREQVIDAYGGKCACCGDAHFEFLTIDHPDGGGRKERETLKMWGGSFVRHLIKQGFPPDYRVLCHNCNSAYGYYGYCPHGADQLSVTVAVADHV